MKYQRKTSFKHLSSKAVQFHFRLFLHLSVCQPQSLFLLSLLHLSPHVFSPFTISFYLLPHFLLHIAQILSVSASVHTNPFTSFHLSPFICIHLLIAVSSSFPSPSVHPSFIPFLSLSIPRFGFLVWAFFLLNQAKFFYAAVQMTPAMFSRN